MIFLQLANILLCLLLSSELIAQTSNTIDTPTIILSTIQRTPISTEQRDGFADIVATTAFKKIGIELIIHNIAAKRALVNANHGVHDGDLARVRGVEKNYPNLVRVPELIWVAEINAFSKMQQVSLSSWQDLALYSSAYIRGWVVFEKNVPELAATDKAFFPEALFKMLDRDRVQLALYEKKMGMSVIKQMGLIGIKPVNHTLVTAPIYIYLHKKHQALIPALAQAIREMKQDGSFQQIMQDTLGKVLSSSELESYRVMQNSFE
ncbi:MAG: transporter substrate-binding domain-containing protein [Oceanospirillaceae bacterium]